MFGLHIFKSEQILGFVKAATKAARTRRQPKQARAKAKVEAILDAAQRLLTHEGPEALNTNRIAAEAGVGVGSIYEYFGSKDGIAVELIERLSVLETTAIQTRLQGIGPDDLDGAIEGAIEEAFVLYANHHALYQALWSMTAVARDVSARPGERALLEAVETRLKRAGIQDPTIVAFTVFHIVDSLALRFAQDPRWDIAAGTKEAARVVRAYLSERKDR